MRVWNPRRGLILAALCLAFATPALAQEQGHEHEYTDTNYDPTTTAPLVLPTNNDFAEPTTDTSQEKTGKSSGFGADAAFDVASEVQAGSITPAYRFSRALAVKLRVPYIFNRTMKYQNFFTNEPFEAEASGLGDVSCDVDYTPRLATPGTQLRFSGTVKLPTGDDEKVVTDENDVQYAVPLGTGSLDFVGRASYARSNSRLGWIVAAMYRLNTNNEISQQFGTNTTTTKTTNGNQLVASAFGRHRVGKGLWVHLGAALLVTSDGKTETVTKDGSGNVVSQNEVDLDQSATLVDLFPGLSYTLGPLNPYLGVRIPVVSNFGNDAVDISRDVSFVLQFSYNPLRLAGS